MMGPFYLFVPRALAVRKWFTRPGRRALVRTGFMALLGVSFWTGIFLLFYRTLVYFRSAELVGELLAYRLLEIVFLAFISVLVISNVITSLSTFFLSGEMTLILSGPSRPRQVYLYKYAETAAVSSWMVALFGLPVFFSYGLAYGAGASYYASSALVLALFVLVPAPIGMILAMLLVRTFPAKRTKDILVFFVLLLVVALYFLVRFVQPERLVDPEAFGEVAGYLASLKGVSSPLLPSHWAVKALWGPLTGGGYEPFWAGMLASTAAALYVIGSWVFEAVYRRGYSRAQEGGRYRTYGLTPTGRLLDRLAGPARTPFKALTVKDVKTFFRDTTQWSQLFLLGALVVVYIYNFRVLPIERFPFATFFLENFISFLNLALAGFVIAAVAVRFVFPAISLEGDAFWLLKASPLRLKDFIWTKFWTAWLPLLLLAESLVLVSDHFLGAGAFMTALSAAAIFFMTFGITGLGVGLGAIYPRFRYENAAQISAGYGGIVYMLLATTFIAGVVALLAWPVYIYFTASLNGVPQTSADRAVSVLCLVAAAALNVTACVWPMRAGLRRLEAMEL